MERERTYVIVSRYFEGSWQRDTEEIRGTFQSAGKRASEIARDLDRKYGNSHFWNVNITNEESSSYMELFHGRLS